MAGEAAGVKATIWHNPRCPKSRETLAILTATGADITIIDYLRQPPTAATLRALYARAGLTPRHGLRADAKIPGDDEFLLGAMAAEPAIIERPIVETSKGVVIARPPERVREIL